MKSYSPAEKLLVEEITHAAQKMRLALKGLSIGAILQLIRKQLGISQQALAKRAGVPQSTVSRIESGHEHINLTTLNKIFHAISCELVILPFLKAPIDIMRHNQAKKIAATQLQYLKGTMNLEEQQPDERFNEELLKQETNRLLQGPDSKLWGE